MNTRLTRPASARRYAPLVLIACLWAALVLTFVPVSSAATGNDGTSSADYERDLRRAARTLALLEENNRHYWHEKDIDRDTFNRNANLLTKEAAALSEKWKAAGKAKEFERDFPKQRVDQAELDAFFPPHSSAVAPLPFAPSMGGTSDADYEHDVERAAELVDQLETLQKRPGFQRGKDAAALQKSWSNVAGELSPLNQKWQVAGKGSEFERDTREWRAAAARGEAWNPLLRQRIALQVMRGLIVVGVIGALFLLSGLLRSANAPPANSTSKWRYVRYVSAAAILWWAVPIGCQLLGIATGEALARLTLNVVIVFAVTGVFYLFTRPPRKTSTPPTRRSRIWWYAPIALIAMCLWAAPLNYQQLGAPSADTLLWFAAKILIAVAVIGTLRLFALRKGPAAKRLSTIYGTAHYAPLEGDIQDETCLSKGLFLGKSTSPRWRSPPFEAPGAPVCSTPEHHTLIVARTRTGKGTRVIVPTLLRYGGSALVIDPKGENAAITALPRGHRLGLGQKVHILNPWNALAPFFAKRGFPPATYNPLDILDRNDPNAVAIAQTLAGAICPSSQNSKDHFWQSSAANVLTAVFLWLADQPTEKKTLARAREIVSLSRQDLKTKFLIPMAASKAFLGAISEMASQLVDMAQETYSGIMANLSESTKFLSDPQIKTATATSSFSMEDLARGKTTVYVVIPTERMDTQKTWLRLVIASAMHIFKNPQAKLPYGHRCLFLIDEFAALGRLDDLPRDISTMSGFGVDFALVIQGLHQLKDHYGEAQHEIVSNCAYKWFCNVNDLDSAKYLSETLGKETVETTSTSDSVSSGNRSSSRGHTTSHGETGRLLLTPDEVLNLGKDVAIAIQPGGHPYYLTPIDYWNLMEAFAGLEEKHPALYWDPQLVYDENPYFAPPPPPGGQDGQTGGNGGPGAKEETKPPPRRKPAMTEEEAREILEVGEHASETEIIAAYHRLMKKVHPDVGGSKYFSQELNAAKAILLGE